MPVRTPLRACARHQWLACTILLVVTSTLWAKQRPLTLAHLCRHAESIVVGKVVGITGYEAEWPGVGSLIFSNVELAIDDTWKGPHRQRLQLQIPGGTLPDGRSMIASEGARFAIGEQVLVFVELKGQQFSVYGRQQGKFRITGRRVAGGPDLPIEQDILTPTLAQQVRALVTRAATTPDEEGR